MKRFNYYKLFIVMALTNLYHLLTYAQTDIYGAQWNNSPVWTQAAGDASLSWMRVLPAIEWWDVEPTRNAAYNWPSGYYSYLQNAVNKGISPIVTVHGTPSWAKKLIPGASSGHCTPISEAYITDFYDFVYNSVLQYKGTGANHWEIWNEPDASYSINEDVFGCWAAPVNASNGLDANEIESLKASGRYFGKFLVAAYNAVKAADPDAKVLCGGLMMALEGGAAGTGSTSLHFFEGILEHLKSVGHPGFDIVSYHNYASWGAWGYDNDMHSTDCPGESRIICRFELLKKMLASYGKYPPILMSEGGLNCHPNNQSYCLANRSLFESDKANYLVRTTTRAKAVGMAGYIWYTLDGPGWRLGELFKQANAPYPAYNTLKKIAPMLSGAEYKGTIGNGSKYEGYLFRKGSKDYRVYWTSGPGASTTEVMPFGATRYVKMGGDGNMFEQSIPGAAGINYGPLVIESSNANIDMQGLSTFIVGSTMYQTFWRGNYGFSRTIPLSGNNILWDQASDWTNAIPHSALPGNGNMQSTTNFIVGNTLSQGYWKGNQGFIRSIPIVNGVVDWASAPSFSGPISIGALPGSGDMQTQSIYVQGNNLYQTYWRGNQGFFRAVPIVNGEVDWANADAFSDPISLSSLPGNGNIQAATNFVFGGKFHQAFWRGNQGYYRTIPIVNGQINWSAAPQFGAPFTPIGLPLGPR